MYEWPELHHKWEHEQITAEQLLGQLVRHGEANDTRLTTLQRRLEMVEQTLAALTARLNTGEEGPVKPHPTRRQG